MLRKPPTKAEVEASRALYRDRFRLLQRRNGWKGIVGKRQGREEARIREELHRQLAIATDCC